MHKYPSFLQTYNNHLDVHECDIDDAHKCVFAVIALLLAAIIYPVQFSKDMENGKITFQLSVQ
jgi:hypothetical protein